MFSCGSWEMQCFCHCGGCEDNLWQDCQPLAVHNSLWGLLPTYVKLTMNKWLIKQSTSPERSKNTDNRMTCSIVRSSSSQVQVLVVSNACKMYGVVLLWEKKESWTGQYSEEYIQFRFIKGAVVYIMWNESLKPPKWKQHLESRLQEQTNSFW